ncbi:MAG: gamma-glutamylcyclotransferase family protein [Thermoleophilia bacterium]
MPLYFAYGSNLDITQMQSRCPGAEPLGIARLDGYRLAFSRFSRTRGCGVADIVIQEGKEVWGLVYRLAESDLSGSLDRHEGYPHNYTRLLLPVALADGGQVEAWAYSVVDKDEHVEPNAVYLEIMRTAAAALGFPEEYQRELERFRAIG